GSAGRSHIHGMRLNVMPASRSVPALCLVGALVWLAPADCLAQTKPNPNKAAEQAAKEQQRALEKAAKQRQAILKKAAKEHKKRVEEVRKLVQEEYKGKESEALKEAYVLVAAANHDYDGHRGKAMKQIELAFDVLDRNIMKNGSLQQRVKTLQQKS